MTSNPKIGPHEEIELELMKVNQKKIALFDFFPEEFREPCGNGEINLIFSKIKSRLKDLEIDVYIFYIHNEKDNAYRLLELINKQLNITKVNIDLEREIGHLLGYKEKDIDFYIDKIQKAK